jgi:hypothetical protein
MMKNDFIRKMMKIIGFAEKNNSNNSNNSTPSPLRSRSHLWLRAGSFPGLPERDKVES